jgi:beta-mannosidase
VGRGELPEDDFYDLCDEYGLVIWHDHMMACGVYELSAEFRENIVAEIIDNVKRVRHHAAIGLWCGNNEQEEAGAHGDGARNSASGSRRLRQALRRDPSGAQPGG